MNILLLTNYFPPEIGSAPYLYYDLAKELVRRGHRVMCLTGTPRYNVAPEIIDEYSKKGKEVINENIEGIDVVRVKLPYVPRSGKIKRGLEHLIIQNRLSNHIDSLHYEPDVMLIYSPPLTLGKTGIKIKKRFGCKMVFNVQDLFPQELIDVGLLKNKIIIKYFQRMERYVYTFADKITVHSEKNKEHVERVLGIDAKEKVEIVENWIDINAVTPGSKINAFSTDHDLKEKFVVSFAGTLGHFQDIEVIIRAADKLKNNEDILFVIVGDGIRKKESNELISKLGLRNVRMIPMVERDKYPEVLWSSDISLVTLNPELRTPPVPSKILSIMSAGIPTIGVMNLEGDGPRLIEKANAGMAFEAADYLGLAEGILELYNDKEKRKRFGRNGRLYVEKNLSAVDAAERYERIFKSMF